jgi:hypothetical protein
LQAGDHAGGTGTGESHAGGAHCGAHRIERVAALAGELGEIGSGFEVFAVPASAARGGGERAGGKYRR